MKKTAFKEANQRVHDYEHLVARWRKIARGARLKLEAFARVGPFPVYHLCTRGSHDGALYVSAGIHGDEPAGPEALACWAEENLAALVRSKQGPPLFILPCLNPWGLVENRRPDALGRDLNRGFHRRISPLRELKRLLVGRTFALGAALHEDYDGRGIYLYEINASPPDIGATLLRGCKSRSIPIDPRRDIEDWPFRNGLLKRRIQPEDVTMHPEALAVYPRHTPHFITFETPSEFSLKERVRAHIRLIEGCIRHVVKQRG